MEIHWGKIAAGEFQADFKPIHCHLAWGQTRCDKGGYDQKL